MRDTCKVTEHTANTQPSSVPMLYLGHVLTKGGVMDIRDVIHQASYYMINYESIKIHFV